MIVGGNESGKSSSATAAPSTNGNPKIVATYDYRDERGVLLYQTVRREPKDFRQRRPTGKDKWEWSLDDVRRVLYRLPELIAAPKDKQVFIVEGEKDVDRLHDLGLCATCNAMGAGKWKAEYNESLRDRHVTIIPDNDKPGREHAKQVARQLHKIAASVHILSLPNLLDKEDVSDFLDKGGTAEMLTELAAEAEPWLDDLPPLVIREAKPANPPATAREAMPVSKCLADVESEDVDWLWENRIARKAMTILDGDPGLGKSTLTLDLAARVSRGWAMPPGGGSDAQGVAGAVLILSAEDHLANTIRPRLDVAGADVSKIFTIEGMSTGTDEERPVVLPFDLNEIEKYIREHEIALVIIDPFVAYLDPEINTHHDHDVRIALAKLKKLAEKTNVAIVLIRHLNKFGAGQALYRGSGSIGITGACRCALLAGKDPNDPDRFVLAGLKNNLGPLPESLAYHLEPAGKVARVEWEPEPCDLTAQDILWQPSRNSPRADAAEAWLRDQLSKHPVEAEVLYKAAEKTGHSKATLRRVKKKLGVATYLEGFGKDGVWMWQLPEVLTTK